MSMKGCLPQCGRETGSIGGVYRYESIGSEAKLPLSPESVSVATRGRDHTWCEAFWQTVMPLHDKLDRLQEKLTAQNLQQRMGVIISLPSEIFKAVSASFLLLSVPQVCGGEMCSTFSNLDFKSPLYSLALGLNALTLLCLLILYFVEVKRENTLISFLEVTPVLPTDGKSVGLRLKELLSESNLEKIHRMDDLYAQVSWLATATYYVNLLVSIAALYEHLFNLQAVSSVYAWATVMKGRLDFARSISNTENWIYNSAYLNHPVQYNDVDPIHRRHSKGHIEMM